MEDMEKYFHMAESAFRSAYNDGFKSGYNTAKEKYGNSRGITHCHKATPEEIEQHGIELWGWRECGKPIIGRWAGFANFCPWCGKVIEWTQEQEVRYITR